MCGIIGYTGNKDVQEIILEGLELLEYRGYDSAGLAVKNDVSGETEVYKCAGRVSDLRKICKEKKLQTRCGIGHTRWATHGGVTDVNAHPHRRGQVTLVHNGIVENYRDLVMNYELADTLKSETDSEVVAVLISHYYKGNPRETLKKVVSKLHGTFALVVMFDDKPGVIYAVRNVSPIVACICDEGAIYRSGGG